MRVVIFGAAGYIGSALRAYLEASHEVVSVDLCWFGSAEGAAVIRGDYRDFCDSRWLGEFDAVILLAGHTSIPMCVGNPYGSWENNVTNFARLLFKLDEQRFLYASSAGVYGGGEHWATEAVRCVTPVNMYDLEKWTIDLLAEKSGKHFFGLRFGTVCGGAPHLRTDTMVNSMTLDGLTKGVITLKNPQCYRPILDICDLCRAVEGILAAKNPPPGWYNLATRNAAIWCIAEDVSLALGGVEIVRKDPTPCYDMTMRTDRFEAAFGFQFTGGVVQMVDSIRDCLPCHQSERTETRFYL